MSLAVSIDSALEENERKTVMDDISIVAQNQVIAELREPALRGEVFEIVDNKENPLLSDLNMVYVHEILDALIACLEGKA